MDRISDAERQRIAELLAEGAPVWRLHKEINRSRYAIRRAVVALHRPPKREPRRSPLRLSLAEREEISRGLAAGEPVRELAAPAEPRRGAAGCGRAAAQGRRQYKSDVMDLPAAVGGLPATGGRGVPASAPGAPMHWRRIVSQQEPWLAIPSKGGACFATGSCCLTTAGRCFLAAGPSLPPTPTWSRPPEHSGASPGTIPVRRRLPSAEPGLLGPPG